MAFVIKACSKDVNRPQLNVLHVEQTRTGSRLVATDGRRLHVGEISRKIKSGNYKPVMTKDTIGLSEFDDDVFFPNWNKVVPDKTVQRGIINLEESGFGKDQNQTAKLAIAVNIFMRQTGETINLRFLDDLPKTQWIVCSQNEKGKAVILKESGAEETNYAVIMPLPPDEVESAVSMALAA
jgi:acetone carboxylase gamma subunit